MFNVCSGIRIFFSHVQVAKTLTVLSSLSFCCVGGSGGASYVHGH